MTMSNNSKPKPKRSVGWLWQMQPSALGVIRITVDDQTDYYFIRSLDSDYGSSYEVNRLVEGEGIACTYNINLQEGNDSCDCPGFCYRNYCKHVDALKAMKAEGRL